MQSSSFHGGMLNKFGVTFYVFNEGCWFNNEPLITSYLSHFFYVYLEEIFVKGFQ